MIFSLIAVYTMLQCLGDTRIGSVRVQIAMILSLEKKLFCRKPARKIGQYTLQTKLPLFFSLVSLLFLLTSQLKISGTLQDGNQVVHSCRSRVFPFIYGFCLGIVFSNLVFPMDLLQTTCCLLTPPSPSPFPCRWLERKIGGTKGKGHRLRLEQFTGMSNEVRK